MPTRVRLQGRRHEKGERSVGALRVFKRGMREAGKKNLTANTKIQPPMSKALRRLGTPEKLQEPIANGKDNTRRRASLAKGATEGGQVIIRVPDWDEGRIGGVWLSW